jgi:hypothetical protein
MAAKTAAGSKKPNRGGWQTLLVIILGVVGMVSLVAFSYAHWAERQLLTTDNYVALMAPVPKDDEVASALGTYVVDSLFDKTDLQTKVTEALPEPAAFLAPTLTDRLDARLTSATTNIVKSDKFQSIWTEANRTAHQRLMDRVRGTKRPSKIDTDFNLDISGVRDQLNAKLGTEFQPLFQQPDGSVKQTAVDLNAKVDLKLDRFRQVVKTVDFVNNVFWLLTFAAILGALVLSPNRRRLLTVLSLTLLVIALLQMIGVKAVRPSLLDQIENQAFKPAVGVVYDSLTASFRHGALLEAVVGLGVFLICLLTQKRFWGQSKFLSRQNSEFKKSSVYRFGCDLRLWLRNYWWWLSGAVVLICLALGAFIFSLDYVGVIQLALSAIIGIELISLVAAKSKRHVRAPM